jgi:hypothetical protein
MTSVPKYLLQSRSGDANVLAFSGSGSGSGGCWVYAEITVLSYCNIPSDVLARSTSMK